MTLWMVGAVRRASTIRGTNQLGHMMVWCGLWGNVSMAISIKVWMEGMEGMEGMVVKKIIIGCERIGLKNITLIVGS